MALVGDKISEFDNLKKQLKFNITERKVMEKLNISNDAFLPILFSIKFGGDWSLKFNSTKVMAIKEKITRYDEEKKVGYTLEKINLFLNPVILDQDGAVYRLEKCGNKKEREIVKRPFNITIEAEYAIRATLNPLSKKISLKKIEGPFEFSGSNAYGVSHEMEHLMDNEISGEPFFEFEYELED